MLKTLLLLHLPTFVFYLLTSCYGYEDGDLLLKFFRTVRFLKNWTSIFGKIKNKLFKGLLCKSLTNQKTRLTPRDRRTNVWDELEFLC